LDIGKALNTGSEKWVKQRAIYLINFLERLSKVDRFGMAIEFCSDSEKSDFKEFLNKIKGVLDQSTEGEDIDKKLSQLFLIFS
jgi:hypothetical protein